MKLDLDPARSGVVPRLAATVVLLRETNDREVEVFCVERSRESKFLGGAIVFPGGKVDAADDWAVARAFEDGASRVAACRETLEEAAILLATGVVDDADVVALRAEGVRDPGAMRAFLDARGLELDLAALRPFSRWVTPEAESRRFDTRFYLAVAPVGQVGAHDAVETMSSFWASPRRVLERFAHGEVQLAPPTHATLAVLADAAGIAAALALPVDLAPICPRLELAGDAMALVLPRAVAGATRYVHHDGRWLPA